MEAYKKRMRLQAYGPHTPSWADVLTTGKPRNSCLGSARRTPQTEISNGFDGLGITPSIESYENVV